jgi:uncharacterized protein (TIGR02246 family)
MKDLSRVLVAAVAMTMSIGPARAQQPAAEAPIRAIVAAQETAWNAGDGDAYAKDVSTDVAFTNIFGMVMYGGADFTARQRQVLSTFFKGTTKRHVIRRIRFVTADVALVDIDNEVRGVKAMPAGIVLPPDGVMRTQLLEVFVKRNGRWVIEAYHNVDTKPAQ